DAEGPPAPTWKARAKYAVSGVSTPSAGYASKSSADVTLTTRFEKPASVAICQIVSTCSSFGFSGWGTNGSVERTASVSVAPTWRMGGSGVNETDATCAPNAVARTSPGTVRLA